MKGALRLIACIFFMAVLIVSFIIFVAHFNNVKYTPPPPQTIIATPANTMTSYYRLREIKSGTIYIMREYPGYMLGDTVYFSHRCNCLKADSTSVLAVIMGIESHYPVTK